MAASLMGIMELVWVNSSSNSTSRPAKPHSTHRPSDSSKAAVAL